MTGIKIINPISRCSQSNPIGIMNAFIDDPAKSRSIERD